MSGLYTKIGVSGILVQDRRVLMGYKRLLKQRKENERLEMVWQESRPLEDITGRRPRKGWELVKLPDGRICQRPPPEWGPAVKGTMTKLSDGTWAYLFDAGPPLNSKFL